MTNVIVSQRSLGHISFHLVTNLAFLISLFRYIYTGVGIWIFEPFFHNHLSRAPTKPSSFCIEWQENPLKQNYYLSAFYFKTFLFLDILGEESSTKTIIDAAQEIYFQIKTNENKTLYRGLCHYVDLAATLADANSAITGWGAADSNARVCVVVRASSWRNAHSFLAVHVKFVAWKQFFRLKFKLVK